MGRQPRRNGGIDLDERDIEQARINGEVATLLTQLKADVDDLKKLVRRALIWIVGFLLTIIGTLMGLVIKLILK